MLIINRYSDVSGLLFLLVIRFGLIWFAWNRQNYFARGVLFMAAVIEVIWRSMQRLLINFFMREFGFKLFVIFVRLFYAWVRCQIFIINCAIVDLALKYDGWMLQLTSFEKCIIVIRFISWIKSAEHVKLFEVLFGLNMILKHFFDYFSSILTQI